MEIAEDWLELAHHFAIERHVHPKNAVGRWMLRSHRDLHEVSLHPRSHSRWWRFFEFVKAGGHFRKIRSTDFADLHRFFWECCRLSNRRKSAKSADDYSVVIASA